jgi:hypothetical protein
MVVEPANAPGACFQEHGWCWLGATSLTIDTIYKRWQATGSTTLDGVDLLPTAEALGEFLTTLRRENGDLIYAYDPYAGRPVLSHSDPFASGESEMALLELYEMTGDPAWLEEARLTNAYKLREEVSADHWLAYSFNLLARLDELSEEDIARAREIGEVTLERQYSLTPDVSTIGIGSNVEALANVALALHTAGEEHTWLRPGLEAFAQYAMSHQLPNHDCDWSDALDLTRVAGGIYGTCEEQLIRVDGTQHWINGAASYLQYLQQTS